MRHRNGSDPADCVKQQITGSDFLLQNCTGPILHSGLKAIDWKRCFIDEWMICSVYAIFTLTGVIDLLVFSHRQ